MVRLLLEVHYDGRFVGQRGDRREVSVHRYDGAFISTIDVGIVAEKVGEFDWEAMRAFFFPDAARLGMGRMFFFPKPKAMGWYLREVEDNKDTSLIAKLGKAGPVQIFTQGPPPLGFRAHILRVTVL